MALALLKASQVCTWSMRISRSQHCALIGSACNQDGRSASLTAPNGLAQQAVYRSSIEFARREPGEVCVTEAHGTGSKLGDSVEFGSIRNFFMRNPAERIYPLAHGAFKTMTGHPMQGAGAIGMLKQIWCLKYACVIPNCHMREINPNCDLNGYPAHVITEIYDLKVSTLHIGITGMGFGGTNCRVDIAGRCQHGHRRVPPVVQDASGAVQMSLSASGKQTRPITIDQMDCVLVSCPKCCVEMCLRCKQACTAEWRTTGHRCSLVRDEHDLYDCCSLCYKGGYMIGSAPMMEDVGNLGQTVHIVHQSAESSEVTEMEQVIDDAGDLCYVHTLVLPDQGPVNFHLVLDRDADFAIYPVVSDAGQEVRIVGPDHNQRDRSWRLDGCLDGTSPPASYNIKFKWDYSGKSISWWPTGEQVRPPEVGQAISTTKDGQDDEVVYSVMCSWSGWSLVDMVYNECDECYEVVTEIGPTGEESFFIVCNHNLSKSIFPEEAHTWDTSVAIAGPATNTSGHSWLVYGSPGETCAISLRISHLPFSTTCYVCTKCASSGERFWETEMSDEVLAKYPESETQQAMKPPKQCYLPMTMFWTSTSSTIEVTALKPGDKVLDFEGQSLDVVEVRTHAEARRLIAHLKTRTTSLAVSADHRIVVPGPANSPLAEKPAGELKQGDLVFCAEKAVPLEKVSVHWLNTMVVEVSFQPDNPVQSFIAPKWCMLTKGGKHHTEASDGFVTDDGF